VKKVLADHLKRNTGDGYIFHGETGNPLVVENHTRRILRPELDAAKVEWHGLHGFRRGLATILHSLDVSELTIKHILRHSTKDVTIKSYIKSNDATSRKALELVEKEFLKLKPKLKL